VKTVPAILLLAAGCSPWAGTAARPVVHVGSKKFPESAIIAEMVADLAEESGAQVQRHPHLGGTQVLWKALLNGAIDVYPEYTGTIAQEILARENLRGEEALRRALAERGVRMSRSLGFSDTYAIGMKEAKAQDLGIRTLSDLRQHPELHFGFSNEFMNRGDGWPSLRDRYRLPQQWVRGLDHDLAYAGLESGAIDATDLYSTDPEIDYYQLRVLQDDLGHFPPYEAVLLYRDDLEQRAPEVVRALGRLEGRISETAMRAMNARAKRKTDRVAEERVAADFLGQEFGLSVHVHEHSVIQSVLARTGEHLVLVSISLAAAILVALPLGIVAARRPRFGQAVLGGAGIIQTIPSLALLVFLIPVLGLGAPTAIVALFLYSLLPIVRNTVTGLHNIPASVRESAEALGLSPLARLGLIELPLSARTILAGIKTAGVINVGTATLGALVGTGGYGQPIFTGITLADYGLIWQGALPAAVMALGVQGLFELAERALVPKGLRIKPGD
jgi:osmoprotectant transport system permease protein